MGHSLRGRLLAWVMLPLAGAVVLAGVVSSVSGVRNWWAAFWMKDCCTLV